MRIVVRMLACTLVSVGLALAWGLLARPSLADPADQEAAAQAEPPGYVGSDTCLTCHDGMRPVGAHSRTWDPRSPAAAHGCETCHGPGEKHVEAGGDAALIRTFHALSPREVGDTCTSCHNRSDHAFWPGSAHDGRNLSCTTCHSVHDPKSIQGQLTRSSQVELCSQCHRQQAAKLDRSGHMPVREGKMQCSSCHNPHGSMNVRLLRTGHSIAESCTSCHTDKRGPFLFEHAPVRESCATCHDPHGSQHERMLVAKQPMLCQRCHIHTRHPSTIYDNALVATSNRIFARSCVTCHSNIHGSNHPSGVTFLR